MSISKKIVERFNNSYIPEPNSGCWLWYKATSMSGYGSMRVGKLMVRAHRLSYQIHHGTILKDLMILHKCNTKLCVNPDHLKAGTHLDNMLDLIKWGKKKNRLKTHCKNGHEYSEDNTYIKKIGRSYGRFCRECKRNHLRKFRKLNR